MNNLKKTRNEIICYNELAWQYTAEIKCFEYTKVIKLLILTANFGKHLILSCISESQNSDASIKLLNEFKCINIINIT